MKVKVLSERTVAEIGSAGQRVVVTRKAHTHKCKDQDGTVSYHTSTDSHREVRMVGLPFVAKVEDKYSSGTDTATAITSGLLRIREDLEHSLAGLKDAMDGDDY